VVLLNPGINGFFKKIQFTNDSVGYVNGISESTDLICLKTTDKGLNWNCNYIQGGYPATNDMYFLNQNSGWIVTGFGGVYKTTNGAINWTRLPYPTSNDLIDRVYFIDALTGFVVARNYSSQRATGLIGKTTNGGQNWNFPHSGYFYIVVNPSTEVACVRIS
jgi:photosystem II stability/assembly factor-like uncharacterized protein